MALVLHEVALRHTSHMAAQQQHHTLLLHQTEHLIDTMDSYGPELERVLDIHRMLSNIPPPPEFQPVPEDEPDAATRVFEVPELADGIFAHLSVVDLVKLQQTNSRLLEIIEESDIAQRRMFLLPDPASSFTMLDQYLEHCVPEMPAWEVSEPPWDSHLRDQLTAPFDVIEVWPPEFKSSGTELDGQLSFIVTFRAADLCGSRRQLPASLRAMYLCQPPVRTVKIRPLCRCQTNGMRRSRSPEPLDTMMSISCCTLGEISDMVREYSKMHRLCPYADASDHDSQGNVRSDFVLTAKLQLGVDDPLNELWMSRLEKKKRSDKVDAAKEALFGAYARCKSSAASSEESKPTPTFLEWQEEHMKTIAAAEAEA
nr:hypothetical protein B0A51_04197 [Rachicladosporium sp. CCFEE 5018]